MSLVSDYTIMADGKWYKNITIYDESQNWFLCFDDNEPPEIVIYNPDKTSSNKQKIIKIREVLKKANIYAKVTGLKATGSRLYPPHWSREFKPSISGFLKIRRRIDITNLLILHDGIFDKLPQREEYVFYDFDHSK